MKLDEIRRSSPALLAAQREWRQTRGDKWRHDLRAEFKKLYSQLHISPPNVKFVGSYNLANFGGDFHISILESHILDVETRMLMFRRKMAEKLVELAQAGYVVKLHHSYGPSIMKSDTVDEVEEIITRLTPLKPLRAGAWKTFNFTWWIEQPKPTPVAESVAVATPEQWAAATQLEIAKLAKKFDYRLSRKARVTLDGASFGGNFRDQLKGVEGGVLSHSDRLRMFIDALADWIKQKMDNGHRAFINGGGWMQKEIPASSSVDDIAGQLAETGEAGYVPLLDLADDEELFDHPDAPRSFELIFYITQPADVKRQEDARITKLLSKGKKNAAQ